MNYNKVIIYFFSGTGNARNVASWIEDEANNEGLDVEVIDIAKINRKEIPIPEARTLVGFCSPTHGFHFPAIMRKFIRCFPRVKNCSAFVLNTRAGLRIGKLFLPGLSGVLHYVSSLILISKGFKIVGLRPVDLPSNWLSIHPAVREKGVKLMFKRNEPIVKRFANNIIKGKKDYRALYDIIQDTLIAPVSIAYMAFGKYVFSKSFVASHDCDQCGLCQKSCPVNAIKKVNGRMFWIYKCESCMKCMSICPKKAIETAHGFIIGFFYVFMNIVFVFLMKLLDDVQIIKDCNWIHNNQIQFLIASVFAFPFLFFTYGMLHWFMRFKWFSSIIIYTSLTKYKFWGRYKAPRVQKFKV